MHESFVNSVSIVNRKEDRAEAREYGISPGKYRVISEVIEKYPNYTVDALKDKPMAELKGMLTNGKGNGKK